MLHRADSSSQNVYDSNDDGLGGRGLSEKGLLYSLRMIIALIFEPHYSFSRLVTFGLGDEDWSSARD